MARLSATAENAMVAAACPTGQYVALFTADPTTSGATGEATGGGYARQAVTWATPASGSTSNTGALTFSVAAATYSYIGVFSAATGGTYMWGAALSANQVYASAGSLVLAIGAITFPVS